MVKTKMVSLPEPPAHNRPSCILVLNAGSSTLRFAAYEPVSRWQRLISGKVDRIGLSGTHLTVDSQQAASEQPPTLDGLDYRLVVGSLLDWLESQPFFASISAVGHRVVHGMKHSEPEIITPELVAELRSIMPFAPDHLPREIRLIETLNKRFPNIPQVACFDTAFHRTMPRVAKLLPIPRRYAAKGVERYGFHGLSYSYLMEELTRLDPAAAQGRVILAHLGSGASLAAVYKGRSIDTSMGFTPTSGLLMGTRTGDLDPGLAYYLARTEQMTAAQFQQMVNHESGLLGVSGKSSDMRELLRNEATHEFAAEAVELFCYQAKKWIGAFAAALGGLDTLVFTGGIGENAPVIRDRICNGLNFLGIKVDPERNQESALLISSATSRVMVRVVRTDEELMIARSVGSLIGFQGSGTRI